jgi:hypothetical protein
MASENRFEVIFAPPGVGGNSKQPFFLDRSAPTMVAMRDDAGSVQMPIFSAGFAIGNQA